MVQKILFLSQSVSVLEVAAKLWTFSSSEQRVQSGGTFFSVVSHHRGAFSSSPPDETSCQSQPTGSQTLRGL